MPSGAAMARAILAGDADPFVVPLHTGWLELPELDKVYSENAVQFVTDALRGTYKHDRKGRLSPSMLGYCPRKNLFTFAGAPALGEDPDSQDLMGLGTWGHLRWQAEGLSYPFDNPYMLFCERWVFDEAMRFGGSIDAILIDGSFFDLKTCHFSVFSKVMEQGMKWEHRKQRAGYFMLTGIDACSWVYEERGSGNYWEIRTEDVGKDTEAYDSAEEELEMLNAHIDRDTLPDMLPDCEMRVGSVYKGCPFRKICPKLNSITEAREAGERKAA